MKNPKVWISWAEMEWGVGEKDRSREIYNVAFEAGCEGEESIWKSMLDKEIEDGDSSKVREIYDKYYLNLNY